MKVEKPDNSFQMNKTDVFMAAYKLQRYCSTVYSVQNSPEGKYFFANNTIYGRNLRFSAAMIQKG